LQPLDVTFPFEIGRYKWEDSGSTYYFSGKIAQARIYNRPLTHSEVQYLYSVGQRGYHTTSKKSS